MNYSPLYRTLLDGKFFIEPRRVNARLALVQQLLEHDVSDARTGLLSERAPMAHVAVGSDGSMAGALESWDDAPENSVAVIGLRGDMLKYGTWCAYGTEEIATFIREAASADNIVGIRLDIDSGGGAVDAVPPLLQAIAYAQSLDKAVVASCDLCASAAYYVACHCDEIVADNQISAEFGSIGVMMQFADYAKYYEQKGITVHTIYSDLSTYKNAPFEAALKGDYASIREEQLNPLAREFQQAVRMHRPGLDDTVDGILSGRMFYALDARKYGLIDLLGDAATATSEVRRLSAGRQLARYASGYSK